VGVTFTPKVNGTIIFLTHLPQVCCMYVERTCLVTLFYDGHHLDLNAINCGQMAELAKSHILIELEIVNK
jgi:hypothetical protein